MTTARSVIAKLALSSRILLLQMFVAGTALAADDIGQRELMQRLDMHDAPLILDVRRPDEFAAGHIPGAFNIPHTEIGDHLHELGSNLDSEVVVYCESGRRAAIAAGILEKAGFTRIRHLQGDMKSWRERSLPMVKGDSKTEP